MVLALGYLLLAIRQDPRCWAFSIASSLLYLVLFARAGLLMQAALQVFFVAMSVYGWRVWKGGSGHAPAPVARWPASYHLLALAAVVAVTLANVALLPQAGQGVV
ncbi:MAG: nicotinamide mononucleotide transporter, partial [Steroidobacteraceae bacterium]